MKVVAGPGISSEGTMGKEPVSELMWSLADSVLQGLYDKWPQVPDGCHR